MRGVSRREATWGRRGDVHYVEVNYIDRLSFGTLTIERPQEV